MICDSCSNTITDSGMGKLLSVDEVEIVAIEVGDKIEDHTCETIDNPEADHCDCNCH